MDKITKKDFDEESVDNEIIEFYKFIKNPACELIIGWKKSLKSKLRKLRIKQLELMNKKLNERI